MSEGKTFLDKVHIKNFLSLRNVTLPLKPLTVLVGPNASGKSNVLECLRFLNWMLIGRVSPTVPVTGFFWAGEANCITYQSQVQPVKTLSEYELFIKVDKYLAEYQLVLDIGADYPFISERLLIKDMPVISIQNGSGFIQDEDGTKNTEFSSNKLALESACDDGNNPITSILTKFIKLWKFFDFQPDPIKLNFEDYGIPRVDIFEELDQTSSISDNGSSLSALFSHWFESDRERFLSVNESLESCLNIRIDRCKINGINRFCLLEKTKRPITLIRASEGTLRLVAYYILLNQPSVPPLIAIEEPERNLHPCVMKDIANVLEQLAERTQVIITTHSSQLLDAFNPQKLSDSLGILLLQNRQGLGTEVINFEDIRNKREALNGWIADFGIGSALFNSELLQDLMEAPI